MELLGNESQRRNSIKAERTCSGVKLACSCPLLCDFGQLAQTTGFNFFIQKMEIIMVYCSIGLQIK